MVGQAYSSDRLDSLCAVKCIAEKSLTMTLSNQAPDSLKTLLNKYYIECLPTLQDKWYSLNDPN